MAQHDYNLADAAGSTFRTDLNNVLAAIMSLNSGSSEPATTTPYMLWVDTSLSPPRLKMRNATDTDWMTLPFRVDTSALATDSIQESTSGEGVTVDGLLIKDGGFELGSDADGDTYCRYGGQLKRIAKGTAGQVWAMNGAAEYPEWVGASDALFNAYVKVSHREAQGTDSASTEGWMQRKITDEDYDTASIASIASNRLTLPAGTYHCRVEAIYAHGIEGSLLRLYNYTTSAIVQEDSGVGNMVGLIVASAPTVVTLSGVFTLAGSSAIEIQQYFAHADSDGAGKAGNISGYEEVYMTAVFMRLS
jgi:hypothetical protein